MLNQSEIFRFAFSSSIIDRINMNDAIYFSYTPLHPILRDDIKKNTRTDKANLKYFEILARACGLPAVGVRVVDCWQ